MLLTSFTDTDQISFVTAQCWKGETESCALLISLYQVKVKILVIGIINASDNFNLCLGRLPPSLKRQKEKKKDIRVSTFSDVV